MSQIKLLLDVISDVRSLGDSLQAYADAAPEILGITAMTKLLGKKKFTEILGELLYKPTGKPTLVPASDKRKAWNPAQEDFKE